MRVRGEAEIREKDRRAGACSGRNIETVPFCEGVPSISSFHLPSSYLWCNCKA